MSMNMENELNNLITQAKNLFSKGIYSVEAIKINEKIIKIDEKQFSAYIRLAKCHQERGNVSKAIELYEYIKKKSTDDSVRRIAIKCFVKNKN